MVLIDFNTRVEDNYDELQSQYKEWLHETWEYSAAIIEMGEIDDGRDEFCKEAYDNR